MTEDWTPPAEAVEAAREAWGAGWGYLNDKIEAALIAARPVLVAEALAGGDLGLIDTMRRPINEAREAELRERIAGVIRARLEGHDFNEPWDKGYKVGLRDALEDIARTEGTNHG